MKDRLYEQFVKQWEDVIELPPQSFGPFTPVYKRITKRLKVMPWVPFGVVSILCVGILYLLFGPAVSFLASLLQRGF